MMSIPDRLLSPKDRLFLALEAHAGQWETIENLMAEAGFIPKGLNRLIAYTSFYFNLCQIEDAGPSNGYRIARQRGNVVMIRKTPA
ncbi:hypothetical protein MPL3356_60592 [Mesorhizobium plurifarium]|uniref:Uncharacterized protein n=1 Tax=Mesorhizobium plurifarium TaxID=69974 RepID=A0A090EFX1_MESPL|nr:hypothetical protein MPL3356_60592 [Mesorhizobium plurifarium]